MRSNEPICSFRAAMANRRQEERREGALRCEYRPLTDIFAPRPKEETPRDSAPQTGRLEKTRVRQ